MCGRHIRIKQLWPRKGCSSLSGMIVPQPIEEIPREKLIPHVAGKKIVARGRLSLMVFCVEEQEKRCETWIGAIGSGRQTQHRYVLFIGRMRGKNEDREAENPMGFHDCMCCRTDPMNWEAAGRDLPMRRGGTQIRMAGNLF
jgi:hypothetical protein